MGTRRFLHYVFDKWMERNYPGNPFCRYADDAVVHCRTETEASRLKETLDARFRECAVVEKDACPVLRGAGEQVRYGWDIVAPPGNQAETEKTNLSLQLGRPRSTRHV
ncbi:MAG: hypothetical protein HWN68_08555 [Desulfobacterales bacterium]|nr:hypothetical protein [Desulfobacterales bacterium]